MAKDSIIIADFEVLSDTASFTNGWNDVDGVDPSVIQIGAIKLTLKDELPITEIFNVLITPRDADGQKVALPAHIQNLTGITQDNMDREGIELVDAVKAFRSFVKRSDIFTYSRTFDFTMLSMSMVNQGLRNLFKRAQFKDIRPVFIKGGVPAERMPQNQQAGSEPLTSATVNSGRVAEFFNLTISGNHQEHDGLSDTLSIHAGLVHLLDAHKISLDDLRPN